MKHDVILWGGGAGYDAFVYLHGFEKVNAVAIIDKADPFYSTIDGIPVIKPDQLNCLIFEYVIVCAWKDELVKNIISDIEAAGIDRKRIIPLRVFKISYFDFDDYIRIKDSEISILSDYCFAGLLYHRFGLMFKSPTINMFTNNENYIRFISRLEHYMEAEMVEVPDWSNRPYADLYTYPRGRIGDVEWIFNHNMDFESAYKRWNTGVKRFNWNNYIVIMTLENDEMAYRFEDVPIKHKIGFYWKELNLSSVICLPRWNDPAYRSRFDYCFSAMVNRIATEEDGVRAVNWMKALLHENDYKRTTV